MVTFDQLENGHLDPRELAGELYEMNQLLVHALVQLELAAARDDQLLRASEED